MMKYSCIECGKLTDRTPDEEGYTECIDCLLPPAMWKCEESKKPQVLMRSHHFGPNLKQYLFQIGMDQRELAVKAQITRANLCQIVNGHKDPAFGTLIRILNALNVSLEFIMIKESNAKDS